MSGLASSLLVFTLYSNSLNRIKDYLNPFLATDTDHNFSLLKDHLKIFSFVSAENSATCKSSYDLQ
jgi:hypothetical protein